MYNTRRDDDGQDPGDDEPTKDGKARRALRGFRIAHVFALEQTDGDAVKPPAAPELLDGEAPPGLWDVLESQVRAEGFILVRAEMPSGANGTTNFTTRTVTVRDRLSAAQACKTLAHELGHVLLHDGTEYAAGCRGRAEVEAESVAHIVCQAAGLTTAAYSFGYVGGWSGGDTSAVKGKVVTVNETGTAIGFEGKRVAGPRLRMVDVAGGWSTRRAPRPPTCWPGRLHDDEKELYAALRLYRQIGATGDARRLEAELSMRATP